MPKANGAFAVFSTLPSDPNAIQANQIYTDTFIVPYEQAGVRNGAYETPAYLGQVSYMFDRQGAYVPLSTTFGHTNGSAVKLTLTGNLAKANLKATVPGQTRMIGADASQSCWDETRELSAAWTGYGGMLGSGKRLHRYSTDCFRWMLHTNGVFRLADARATVDNVDLGAPQYAELGNYNDVAVIICFDSRG